MKFLFSIVLLFHFAPGFCQGSSADSTAGDDIYSFKNSKKFATYLFKSNQFSLASQELERLYFMNPSDDSVKLLLIQSYCQGKDFKTGIKRSEEIFSGPANIPANISISYAQMLLLNNDKNKLHSFLESNQNIPPAGKDFFLINGLLFEKNWKEAKVFWEHSDSTFKKSFAGYRHVIENGTNLKYKSPFLATSLSILIPGTGKFYTKDWVDGLLSLATIGALTFQAYRGFSAKGAESTYGWIFGSLAFGFYTGNIFGSYKAARKYNERLDSKILLDVEHEFKKPY